MTAKTTIDADVVAKYDYLYDKNRSITSQTVTGSAGGYTNLYEYAPGRQLKKWTHDATSGGGTDKTVTYGWDANSNRTQVNDSVDGVTTTSYWRDNSINVTDGPGNNAVPTTNDQFTHSYDNAGRLTNDGCSTYLYDAFDRVRKQTFTNSDPCGGDSRSTTYTYDGLDRQRTLTVAGSSKAGANRTTRSAYDGTSTTLIGQTDAINGTRNGPQMLYQLDPGGAPIAYTQTVTGTGKAFLDTDGRGNITTIKSTASGNPLVCAARMDPFGTPVDADGGTEANGVCHNSGAAAEATGNSYWYRGQVRDGSTGNYQLGTRTYDPTKAAFTTPDSYRISTPLTDLGVGTDPLTANTYTYVNGNPINMIDPDGHKTLDGGGGGGSAADAVRTGRTLTGRVTPQKDESFLSAIWNDVKPVIDFYGDYQRERARTLDDGLLAPMNLIAVELETIKVVAAPLLDPAQLVYDIIKPTGDAISRGDWDAAAGHALVIAASLLTVKGKPKLTIKTDAADANLPALPPPAVTPRGTHGDGSGGVADIAVPGRGTSPDAKATKQPPSTGGLSTYYTVQSADDAARLSGGGAPWPTSMFRAEFGPGVYAWGNADDAARYAAHLREKRGACVQVCEFSVDTSNLRYFDVDALEDASGFMSKFSQPWGGTSSHGFDHISRGTQYGTQHYFAPDVFRSATWNGSR